MVSDADRQAVRPPAGPHAGEVAAPVGVAGWALDGGPHPSNALVRDHGGVTGLPGMLTFRSAWLMIYLV
jgi:hypothetical protein